VRGLLLGIVACGLALSASACSGGGTGAAAAERKPQPRCPAAWRPGWQALANRIDAPVYCPRWMPSPIDALIGGQWNNIDSVDPDRSYLLGFVWQETGNGSGEVHVNFRGYPGVTRIPRCPNSDTGKERRIPCFSDPGGTATAPGIRATLYTVNQGADTWHLLYAWRHGGSLYTVSQHVAPPLTFRKVRADLDRMLRSLVLVRPRG
jgi:hypothetical protein